MEGTDILWSPAVFSARTNRADSQQRLKRTLSLVNLAASEWKLQSSFCLDRTSVSWLFWRWQLLLHGFLFPLASHLALASWLCSFCFARWASSFLSAIPRVESGAYFSFRRKHSQVLKLSEVFHVWSSFWNRLRSRTSSRWKSLDWSDRFWELHLLIRSWSSWSTGMTEARLSCHYSLSKEWFFLWECRWGVVSLDCKSQIHQYLPCLRARGPQASLWLLLIFWGCLGELWRWCHRHTKPRVSSHRFSLAWHHFLPLQLSTSLPSDQLHSAVCRFRGLVCTNSHFNEFCGEASLTFVWSWCCCQTEKALAIPWFQIRGCPSRFPSPRVWIRKTFLCRMWTLWGRRRRSSRGQRGGAWQQFHSLALESLCSDYT